MKVYFKLGLIVLVLALAALGATVGSDNAQISGADHAPVPADMDWQEGDSEND